MWSRHLRAFFACGLVMCVLLGVLLHSMAAADSDRPGTPRRGQHLVTIYDGGQKRAVLTEAKTVRDTLQQAGISVAKSDRVEPALDTTYASEDYTVNIYRSYPVLIEDGARREHIVTPYRSATDIVRDAGLTVRPEDELRVVQSSDLMTDGAGAKLVITRAIPVKLSLYGTVNTVYTQASTVGELLREKKVELGSEDVLSLPESTPIAADMTLEVWRNGAQTITAEEEIPFTQREVLSMDQPVGTRTVQSEGKPGKKQLVYEVVMQNGQELSRTLIQEITTEQPTEQVELVGNQPRNPLTSGKGAQQWTDSKGVTHRETYYDLNMSVTMNACGGGSYTVREDGAKVDKDGYILIAANLGNYPRCSIVETSMGLGKVYDTGGFAAVHPHGFDIATDWTKRDGV